LKKLNILILTRVISNNSNSIYNSYSNGIINNYPETTEVIDYFDLYFQYGKARFESFILDTIQEKSINLIFINFVSGDFTFELQFLKQLADKAFMMMNFYDSELFFEPIDRYYAQCADLVLLPTASDFTYSYKVLGINAISTTLSLFDSKLYTKQNLPKDIDVSFVGDVSKKSRQQLIKYLHDNGIDIEVFGNRSKHGLVDFKRMVEIFNRSKINLNFSDTVEERSFNKYANINYTIVPKIVRYMTQLKGRSIEVSLCGSFTLSQDATGLQELFTNKEIASFQTKEELLQKITYFLEHEKEREAMANRAYTTALKRYDATDAFHKILNEITLHDRKKKTIYLDDSFISDYYTYHTLYLFNFLFKFKISLFIEEFRNINMKKIKLKMTLKYALQQLRYRLHSLKSKSFANV